MGQTRKDLMEKLWKLESDKSEFLFFGEVVPGYQKFDSKEQYLLDQLNHFDPFDFEYIPKEGDKLSITWNKKQYNFIVKGFQWRSGKK